MTEPSPPLCPLRGPLSPPKGPPNLHPNPPLLCPGRRCFVVSLPLKQAPLAHWTSFLGCLVRCIVWAAELSGWSEHPEEKKTKAHIISLTSHDHDLTCPDLT